MRKSTIVSCLFLILFITNACNANEKAELSKVEIAMVEMGNNIGFEYLRSSASPEIIEAQILATIQNMKTLQDAVEEKSDVIRKVRLDEIKHMILLNKIHEQPQKIRFQIADIFMEKFNPQNIGNGEDLVNLTYEVEEVLSK
jgi:hypothetical protein